MKTQPPEKCLVCQSVPVDSRGLCNTCLQSFNRAKKKLPEEKHFDYEMSLIEDGLLLPLQTKKIAARNVFQDRVNQMLDPSQQFVVEAKLAVAETQNEYDESAKKAKKAAPQKRRGARSRASAPQQPAAEPPAEPEHD